jgi:hypothetical protein
MISFVDDQPCIINWTTRFGKWLDLQGLFSGLPPRCSAQRRDLTVVLKVFLISDLEG